jgi:NAD(P)-dependent dehydrogenase (short-subunit alcohol dehydrogenase family)
MEQVRLSLLSVVYFAQAVVPHMQRQSGGRIVTITSITTKRPVADRSIQCSARWCYGASSESRQRIQERAGILVNNNVGPGFTATDRLKELATARSAGRANSRRRFSTVGRLMLPYVVWVNPTKSRTPSFGSRPIVLRTSQGKHFLLMVVSTRAYRVSNLESFLQQLLRRT